MPHGLGIFPFRQPRHARSLFAREVLGMSRWATLASAGCPALTGCRPRAYAPLTGCLALTRGTCSRSLARSKAARALSRLGRVFVRLVRLRRRRAAEYIEMRPRRKKTLHVHRSQLPCVIG